MKKLIIVNNNMKVGGVQKSLCNLLWALEGRYDLTLYLFSARGEYLRDIPESVRVVEGTGLVRLLGMSQGECQGLDRLKRGALVLLCRVFGRARAMKLLLACTKGPEEKYDCAVAYLQNGNIRHFYGGVPDFVLRRVTADRKIAFLHCDYANCGANHPQNNRLLREFDRIAACSEGCRQAFAGVLPELAEKCVTVKNCHNYRKIHSMAEEDPVEYDKNFRNVVMVSRLSHEKGIERAIEAAARAIRRGLPVKLHIVGGGQKRAALEEQADRWSIREHVRFYGEQANPYRFMKQADLFLMTSFHEAAPMVIDEALCLGVPVLTTETTSSRDMVTAAGGGWVCANSQEALNEAFYQVLAEESALAAVRARLAGQPGSNHRALTQFYELTEG